MNAILITIMVRELKAPHGTDLAALRPIIPAFLSYVPSFLFVGIYWNNHHHMRQVIRSINGRILWANSHLLFWLSLVPFVTWWMGENHFASVPTALYGVVLPGCAIAYTILLRTILAHEGKDSPSRRPSVAIGRAGFRSRSTSRQFHSRSWIIGLRVSGT